MIRTRKVINKSDIFNYVGNKNIAKVEILTSKQKTLVNKDLCSVYIYHRINFTDICSIVGKCKLYPKDGYNVSLVYGICSSLADGFISICNIKKLIEIEQNTGYSFNISKNIKSLV